MKYLLQYIQVYVGGIATNLLLSINLYIFLSLHFFLYLSLLYLYICLLSSSNLNNSNVLIYLSCYFEFRTVWELFFCFKANLIQRPPSSAPFYGVYCLILLYYSYILVIYLFISVLLSVLYIWYRFYCLSKSILLFEKIYFTIWGNG